MTRSAVQAWLAFGWRREETQVDGIAMAKSSLILPPYVRPQATHDMIVR